MLFKKQYLAFFFTLPIALMPLKSAASEVTPEVYSIQLFFGLSIPDGEKITLQQWDDFVANNIAKRFDGFNIVDSEGYWKGKPERSKIVTIIAKSEEVSKAESIAHDYATMYHQDSVMLVKKPINKWEFVPSD